MGEKKENFITIFSTLIILIGTLAIVFLPGIIKYGNNQTIEITIKDKFIKNAEDSGKYLIVDTNNNTYQITDLMFKGKFNSTDIYNALEIGKTYKVETSGKRIHFFSMYPNINKIIEEQ